MLWEIPRDSAIADYRDRRVDSDEILELKFYIKGSVNIGKKGNIEELSEA